MTDIDYRIYYDLEQYLFRDVNSHFRDNRKLDAFDFFCIVIWKANRAKSRVASLLLKKFDDLEKAVADLTSKLAEEKDNKARLELLVSQWEFHLPMASAILTVLYPCEFTIYDIRVCGVLRNFHKAQDRLNFNQLWSEYQDYVEAVRREFPADPQLREKDKWLWGKSFFEQLRDNISTQFKKVFREAALSWIRGRPVGQKFTYRDLYKFLEGQFPDECVPNGNADYKQDARDAVKTDAIAEKLIRSLGKLGPFERIDDQNHPTN